MKKIFLFGMVTLAALCGNNVSALTTPIFSHQISEEQKIIITNGQARLFCRVMGSGFPIIVLHGGPGLSQDYLLPHMLELAKNNLVIFYDQRGCGSSVSEVDSDSINMDSFIGDLDAIRKYFGFQKITILGHSWGGFLAMKYTLSHPECVDKLILSNSMPSSSNELSLFIDEYVKRMAPYQTEIQKIQNSREFAEGNPDVIEKYYRIIFRTYCQNAKSADSLNLRMSSIAAINGAKVGDILRIGEFSQQYDLQQELRKLDIPTLIIHGDTDPIPYSSAASLHRSIKGSKYVLIENCGHFPFIEDTQVFFNTVNAFLTNGNTDHLKKSTPAS